MIKPEDVRKFAASLVDASNPSEVDARQAAARAYYSVFLLMRDRLGVQSEKGVGPVHEMVRQELLKRRLENGRLEPCEQLALNFWQSMYDDRITADYKLDKDFTLERGRRAIARAEQIFKAIS